MSLSSIATEGFLTGSLGCIATEGILCAAAVVEPVPQPEIPGTGGGGRYDPGYTRQREDALKETRRRRILQEDEEVIALIMAMVTEGLM